MASDSNHSGQSIRDAALGWMRKATAWRHRLPWAREAGLQKYDIVNVLARKHGYGAYLEICTGVTGGRFGRIDRKQFQVCHRLMYRCPPEFVDGNDITFRTTGDSIDGLIDPSARYDIMLIDPWHTFEASLHALEVGFSLLRQGGTMVVHDCSPPSQEMTAPEYRPGAWCGVTYRAYLEFVWSRGLRYYTVDTDYGCGVVRKNEENQSATEPARVATQQWRDLRDDEDPFPFFSRHRRELLNLISVDEFLLAEDLRMPLPVRYANLLRRMTEPARRILARDAAESRNLEVVTSAGDSRMLKKVRTKL